MDLAARTGYRTPQTPETSASASRESSASPGDPETPDRHGGGQVSQDARPPTGRRHFDTATVSLGELAVLAVAVGIGVVAMVSLATAHLGIFGPATVAAGSAAVLAALGGMLWVVGGLPRVVVDPAGLLVLAGTAALALLMFLPGFHYAVGDRDPGAYVMHAAAIAQHGSEDFVDPVLADSDLPVQPWSPGARFPAIWVADDAAGQIEPQFYHLWPALLATGYELAGFGGAVNTTPLVAVVAVLLCVAVARRVGGLPAAVVAGVLLSTNMLQVWQAKYPTSEILTQMLFLVAVLGLAMALQTRWRWPALVAGLFVGIGFLARADGLLLLLLAVGVGAALWVLRRFDARCAWFAAGLAVVLPYTLYQAYGPAMAYTKANGLPSMPVVLLLIGACVVAALVLRPLLGGLARWVGEHGGAPRVQRRAGAVVVACVVGLFGLGLVRPKVFGDDYMMYGSALIRSYDERSLYWLSWLFTWPGLLLVVGGVAAVALRRWSATAWMVVIPVLVFLPVYAWHARNSPYLMWWGRRYVSTLLPGMILLIALAAAALWATRGTWRRWLTRGVAAGLVAFLAVVYVDQSRPLRGFDEWGGSYGISQQVAELSGDRQGVFLWQPAQYCCTSPPQLFGAAVWLLQDQVSVLLPTNPRMVGSYVQSYVREFADQPVFLVYDGSDTPPAVPGLSVTPVREFSGGLRHWTDSSIERPDHFLDIPYRFTVYRVQPGGGSG